MTRKKLPEEVEERLAKVGEDPGGSMMQPSMKHESGKSLAEFIGAAPDLEAKSIKRDCARGEHDGEVVLKEGKGGLGMPEVRVCERCAGLFVRKA